MKERRVVINASADRNFIGDWNPQNDNNYNTLAEAYYNNIKKPIKTFNIGIDFKPNEVEWIIGENTLLRFLKEAAND